jgi:membrane dipeptidase
LTENEFALLLKHVDYDHDKGASMTVPAQMPIFDGHNDTLLKLSPFKREGGRSFFAQSSEGHLDLPRARAGGFGGGIFAICVPTNAAKPDSFEDALTVTETGYEVQMLPACDHEYAQRFTISAVASLFRLEAASDGQLKVVRTADELVACLQQGVLAAVLHFEGAEAIDPGLDALYVFYEAGLRSLGIVWSRPNAFGHGVPFRFPSSPDTGPGLTDAGRELVRTCNQLGVLLDLAHLNERGFWDVAQLSDAPLVSSHAGVHALSPSARNLTDKQLDAIGESGGVVGVNFHVSDLRADGRFDADTPLTETVRHIDYIAERIGVDHVAFGSDFDGALMSLELGDAAGLPKLVAALRAHGCDDAALQKITHENWIRVLRSTWSGNV